MCNINIICYYVSQHFTGQHYSNAHVNDFHNFFVSRMDDGDKNVNVINDPFFLLPVVLLVQDQLDLDLHHELHLHLLFPWQPLILHQLVV